MADPSPTISLSALARLLSEATPGPWTEHEGDNWSGIVDADGDAVACISDYETDANHLGDRALIVALRNAGPSLVEIAEAVREHLEWWDRNQDYLPAPRHAVMDRLRAALAKVQP